MSIDVDRLAQAIANVTNEYIAQDAEDIAREYDRLAPAPSDALREEAQAVLTWLCDGDTSCECCGMFDDEGHEAWCVVPPLRAALAAQP